MCGRGYNYRTGICFSIVLVLLPLLFSAPQFLNFPGLLGWEVVGLQPTQTSSVFLAAKPSSASVRVRSLHSPSTAKDQGSISAAAPKWAQKTITLPPQRRGCHLITPKHTSASLTINENYDSDVQDDMETFLNRIVPEGRSAPWKHTIEGPDDMPAHIKSSMFGCPLTVPISNGQLNMGTWQGIWLCEHQDNATPRNVVATLDGI